MKTEILLWWAAAALLITSASLHADEVYTNMQEMNGIQFSDIQGFMNWNLVTTRFRRDTEEIRFTYANKKAFAAMDSKDPYPDGSVFVKLAQVATEDEAFPSSLAPGGAARILVMVRDAKKYKSTSGWGYAMFSRQGNTPKEGGPKRALACASCHDMVADRRYVFSQKLNPFAAPEEANEASEADPAVNKDPLVYRTASTAELEPRDMVRKFLSRKTKFRSLTGPLQKSKFTGTYNEILPALTKEAERSGMPAVLMGQHGGFAVADQSRDSRKGMSAACEKKGKKLYHLAYSRPRTTSETVLERTAIQSMWVCQ